VRGGRRDAGENQERVAKLGRHGQRRIRHFLDPGGRCYYHKFSAIFDNFGRKNGVFLKNR
jgi:hypothetical protein